MKHEYAYCANCEAPTGWHIGTVDGKREIACDVCEEIWLEEEKGTNND